MKKTIKALLCICSVSFLIGCQPVKAAQTECEAVSYLAEAIMGSRQAGVSMRKMFEVADEAEDQNTSILVKILIEEAFEKPRYATEEGKKRAIVDFGDEIFVMCLRQQKSTHM